MTKFRETIVPATAELVEAYRGHASPYSFRGWVALRDGVPIGMAGIYDEDGTPVAFSEFREDTPPSRRTMVRGVQLVRQMLKDMKRPVVAICSPKLPTSKGLLAKLGFEPAGETCERGEIMVRAPA